MGVVFATHSFLQTRTIQGSSASHPPRSIGRHGDRCDGWWRGRLCSQIRGHCCRSDSLCKIEMAIDDRNKHLQSKLHMNVNLQMRAVVVEEQCFEPDTAAADVAAVSDMWIEN